MSGVGPFSKKYHNSRNSSCPQIVAAAKKHHTVNRLIYFPYQNDHHTLIVHFQILAAATIVGSSVDVFYNAYLNSLLAFQS